MINFKIPTNLINEHAFEICKILHQDGHQAYITGECIRDLLIGNTTTNWNISTDAQPQRIIELFVNNLPKEIQYGTISVLMDKKNIFEISTFRLDGEYKENNRESFFVMNVEQDLSRRDITINSIAYDPILKYITDPFNGIYDLQNHIIRAVGNPTSKFKENPLNIIKTIKYASIYGDIIDQQTFDSIILNSKLLNFSNKEYIKNELCQILMSANPAYGLQLLNESNVLNIICPFLTSNDYHLNFIKLQDNCNGDLETKIAFMYANCNSKNTIKELINLKFSNKQINRVGFLLTLLDRYVALTYKDSTLAYKSFMATIKNHSPDPYQYTFEQFIQLTEALGYESKSFLKKFENEIVLSIRDMKINSYDLIEVGFTTNQAQKILYDCYLEILKNENNNSKDILLKYALSKR